VPVVRYHGTPRKLQATVQNRTDHPAANFCPRFGHYIPVASAQYPATNDEAVLRAKLGGLGLCHDGGSAGASEHSAKWASAESLAVSASSVGYSEAIHFDELSPKVTLTSGSRRSNWRVVVSSRKDAPRQARRNHLRYPKLFGRSRPSSSGGAAEKAPSVLSLVSSFRADL